MSKSYFDNLPNTLYSFDDTQIITLKHIFRRFDFIDSVKSNIKSFDTYKIGEGETPDMIAYKFYKDPQLYWIILVFNDIIDPFGQWPMNHQDLVRYATDKYGAANVYTNAHWVNAKGQSVDPNYYLGVLGTDGVYVQDMIPLTNFDYEEMINDSKRKIYIPKEQYINRVISQVEGMF